MEVHDAFAKAYHVKQHGDPERGGPGNSEKLEEDRPPARGEGML